MRNSKLFSNERPQIQAQKQIVPGQKVFTTPPKKARSALSVKSPAKVVGYPKSRQKSRPRPSFPSNVVPINGVWGSSKPAANAIRPFLLEKPKPQNRGPPGCSKKLLFRSPEPNSCSPQKEHDFFNDDLFPQFNKPKRPVKRKELNEAEKRKGEALRFELDDISEKRPDIFRNPSPTDEEYAQ